MKFLEKGHTQRPQYNIIVHKFELHADIFGYRLCLLHRSMCEDMSFVCLAKCVEIPYPSLLKIENKTNSELH